MGRERSAGAAHKGYCATEAGTESAINKLKEGESFRLKQLLIALSGQDAAEKAGAMQARMPGRLLLDL